MVGTVGEHVHMTHRWIQRGVGGRRLLVCHTAGRQLPFADPGRTGTGKWHQSSLLRQSLGDPSSLALFWMLISPSVEVWDDLVLQFLRGL